MYFIDNHTVKLPSKKTLDWNNYTCDYVESFTKFKIETSIPAPINIKASQKKVFQFSKSLIWSNCLIAGVLISIV